MNKKQIKRDIIEIILTICIWLLIVAATAFGIYKLYLQIRFYLSFI